jgi:hypothetical protein
LIERWLHEILRALGHRKFSLISSAWNFKTQVGIRFALNRALRKVSWIFQWITLEYFGGNKLNEISERLAVQSTSDCFCSGNVTSVSCCKHHFVASIHEAFKLIHPNFGDSLVILYPVILTVVSESLVVVLVTI